MNSVASGIANSNLKMQQQQQTNTKLSDFQVLSKLGEGAFSEVFRVKRKSDSQEYALKKVKLMKLSDKEKDNALNEVRILASVEHPNIAGYKEAFFEESTSTLCIVMEFADGGDLLSKINSLKRTGSFIKEEDAWSIFYQMVVGLQALHKVKIVHRDIKCANVFLTKDGIVKLGDLNVSKIAKMGVLKTQTGTPYYASPEVWQDKPYDKKSDIWSLGCVLYELVALHPPFEAKDMQGLYKKVLTGNYPKIPAQYSSDLNAMLKALLQVDPKNRPTTKQIVHMPVFVAKYNEIREIKTKDFEDDDQGLDNMQNQLLGTIKVPKNLRLLSERLPKSNYEKKPKKEKSQSIDLNDRAGADKVNKSMIQEQLYAIQEEETQNSGSKLANLNSIDGQNRVIAKPPVGRGKISSQRSLSAKAGGNNGIIQNQLAEKGQQIAQKHRIVSSDRYDPSTQVQQQKQVYSMNQQSQERQQNVEEDPYIRVQQYRKKLYVNNIPKTSPAQRNGIADLYYQIAHGKGALIDKHLEKQGGEQIQYRNQEQNQIQSYQAPIINQIDRRDSRLEKRVVQITQEDVTAIGRPIDSRQNIASQYAINQGSALPQIGQNGRNIQILSYCQISQQIHQ